VSRHIRPRGVPGPRQHAGTAAWQSDGYTDALWLATVKDIASFFATSFVLTPVFPLVDMTFFEWQRCRL
jgi:hypothetical protein